MRVKEYQVNSIVQFGRFNGEKYCYKTRAKVYIKNI